MDNRVGKAAARMRRNRKDIHKASGIDQFGAEDRFTPTNDPRVFEDVDATPEEIVLYFEALYKREREKVANLYAYAQSGLATEMTMHEANSLLSWAKAETRSLIERYPEEKTLKGLWNSVSRLDDNFSFLSRFKVSGYTSYRASPEKALAAVKHEFGRSINSGALVIEATEAFMKAEIANDERILYSAFLNLVRNSYQLGTAKPVVVRFDAERIEHEVDDYDEETDTVSKKMGYTDIVIVEDNGPGLRPRTGDEIFHPGVSGRNSSGIGLHLVRSGLESTYLTIVIDENSADLGGARFKIGKSSLLRPNAKSMVYQDRPTVVMLAEAMTSMRELVEQGYNEDAVQLSDVYEEAAGTALRIRLRGAETDEEATLVEAVSAFEEALKGVRPIQEVLSAPCP